MTKLLLIALLAAALAAPASAFDTRSKAQQNATRNTQCCSGGAFGSFGTKPAPAPAPAPEPAPAPAPAG